jgi:glycosyltransferase involved in cell wall biosynthesis
MSQSEPLVSVVTPVYNTDDFLEQAIRSVLAQTHSNFEYVICDNHSTDRTGEIARDYALKDSRIRVVTPPQFLRQAQNFNYALCQMSSESVYCKMLLADDWLYPECVKSMVALAETNPQIAMVSAYRLIENEVSGYGLSVEKSVISGREACRMYFLDGIFLFATNSSVIYRSDVVRARAPEFHPEERVFFDTDAAFLILEDRDFGFIHQVLSFSRFQPGSLSDEIQYYYPQVIDRLLVLAEHGSKYLTPEELATCVSNIQSYFYECLGREWIRDRFKPRTNKFWEYQRRCLKTVGQTIRPELLALGAARAVLKTLASPLDVARALRG